MFDFLKHRSSQEELMDDFDCQGDVVNQTLRELHQINTYLGGNQLSLNALKKLISSTPKEQYNLADLGCGGGEMLRLFDNWATKAHIKLFGVGVDANPNIVEFAKRNVESDHISFESIDILSEDFKSQTYDVIHCSLFLHHFTGKQIISLFEQFSKQARLGVIINDLHRHWISYYFTKYLIVSWSKSEMVKFDSVVSVARSFTKKELTRYLKEAGITNYSLKWKWAFRWELVITNQNP